MKRFFIFLCLLSAAFSINAAEVRVLLAESKTAFDIKASGPFIITDFANNKNYKTAKGGSFHVSAQGKNLKIGNLSTAKGARIKLQKAGDFFTFKGNRYKGPLNIQPSSPGIYIIEAADLEDYLLGVLPYEMSHSWPLEALKAQAVAARTFTLKTLEAKHKRPFDLYSDVRSQMYKGSVKVYDSVKKAVEGTKGEVLKYKNELFYTYYHSNCGGHTNANAYDEDIKPLKGAKCGYCGKSPNAAWKKTLPSNTINNYLKKNNIKGEIKTIKAGKKLSGGRAETVILVTNKQKKEVNCSAFRMVVGPDNLKSCVITKSKGLQLEGRGYGHGKGLCQEGAKNMALQGKNYKNILNTYYPGSKIKKI